jgi:hypothetical protein
MRNHDAVVSDFAQGRGMETDRLKCDANDAVAMTERGSVIKIKDRGMSAPNFGESGPDRAGWRLACGMITHDGKILLWDAANQVWAAVKAPPPETSLLLGRPAAAAFTVRINSLPERSLLMPPFRSHRINQAYSTLEKPCGRRATLP